MELILLASDKNKTCSNTVQHLPFVVHVGTDQI